MSAIASNSVALVVTSPPLRRPGVRGSPSARGHVPASYLDYLQMLEDVFAECVRTLQPGGASRSTWPTSGASPTGRCRPTSSPSSRTASACSLQGRGHWRKGKGASGSCAWGSFKAQQPGAARPHRAGDHRQQGPLRPRRQGAGQRRLPGQRVGSGLLWADDFMDMQTTDLWEIPRGAWRVGHPAPFPVEVAQAGHRALRTRRPRARPVHGCGQHRGRRRAVGRHFVATTPAQYVALAEGHHRSRQARAETVPRPVITLPPAPRRAATTTRPDVARAVLRAEGQGHRQALLLQCGFEEITSGVKAPGGDRRLRRHQTDGQVVVRRLRGVHQRARAATDAPSGRPSAAPRSYAAVDPGPATCCSPPTPRARSSAGAKGALAAVTGVNGPVYDVIRLLGRSTASAWPTRPRHHVAPGQPRAIPDPRLFPQRHNRIAVGWSTATCPGLPRRERGGARPPAGPRGGGRTPAARVGDKADAIQAALLEERWGRRRARVDERHRQRGRRLRRRARLDRGAPRAQLRRLRAAPQPDLPRPDRLVAPARTAAHPSPGTPRSRTTVGRW